MKIVQFKIDDEEQAMLEALRSHAGSKARSKVFKFALRKTFLMFNSDKK